MKDLVGERLKKQVQSRRRDRMHYVLLYGFLVVNAIYIGSQLIKNLI